MILNNIVYIFYHSQKCKIFTAELLYNFDSGYFKAVGLLKDYMRLSVFIVFLGVNQHRLNMYISRIQKKNSSFLLLSKIQI